MLVMVFVAGMGIGGLEWVAHIANADACLGLRRWTWRLTHMSGYTPESGQCSNGPLLFSASGLPTSISLGTSRVLITVVLPHRLANRISPAREYTVTLTASDGVTTASTSATVTTRNEDYALPSPDDRSNNDGDYVYLNLQLLWVSAYAGPNTEVQLVFSASNLPIGLSMDVGTGDSFCTGGGEL